MKLIEPNLIPEAILRLIDEAASEIMMVTPTCKFSNWTDFLKKMDQAKKRNVKVSFFIKDGDYKSLAEVETLNLMPQIIKNLNSIIFFNEQYAIIATKSLIFSDDGSSLEIAFTTTERYEYNEIKQFFKTYISNSNDLHIETIPIHRYLKFEVGITASL